MARSIRRQGSLADFAGHISKEASITTVNEIKELFRSCDKGKKIVSILVSHLVDGDGELTEKELGAVMTELGIVHSETELAAMFKQLDADGNGAVTFEEFLRGLQYMEKSKR